MTHFDDPVWIATLREECRKRTQGKVAAQIGYSPAVVNQVLQGKYKGDIHRVERAVRGAFMGETVDCPVMGEIPANRCMDVQKQPYASTNPQRIRLYRACRAGCANSQLEGTKS